jgi:hypothetical protein
LCSVLQHLPVDDQEATMREVERVLRPGGLAGLTFDFGVVPSASNAHPRGTHEPPADVAEVRRRYLQRGLIVACNTFQEEPIAGSLFSESTPYTLASLILAKPPALAVAVPACKAYPRNAGSAIRQLPLLAHRWGATRRALLHDLQVERERWRLANSERWRALVEKEAEIQRLRAELEARQEVIDDLQRRRGSGAISESEPVDPTGWNRLAGLFAKGLGRLRARN